MYVKETPGQRQVLSRSILPGGEQPCTWCTFRHREHDAAGSMTPWSTPVHHTSQASGLVSIIQSTVMWPSVAAASHSWSVALTSTDYACMVTCGNPHSTSSTHQATQLTTTVPKHLVTCNNHHSQISGHIWSRPIHLLVQHYTRPTLTRDLTAICKQRSGNKTQTFFFFFFRKAIRCFYYVVYLVSFVLWRRSAKSSAR